MDSLLQVAQKLQGDTFEMTTEESDRFLKAFKEEEFRKMFSEYVDEIQDPKHRAENEEYLRVLEGNNQVPSGKRLIRPTPCFVLKTTYASKGGASSSRGAAAAREKLFVNVVASEVMEKPSSAAVKGGSQWTLPHAAGPPRVEKDRRGSAATAIDVCFHPRAMELLAGSPALRELMASTALETAGKVLNKGGLGGSDESRSGNGSGGSGGSGGSKDGDGKAGGGGGSGGIVDQKYHVLQGVLYKSGEVHTMMVAEDKLAKEPGIPAKVGAEKPSGADADQITNGNGGGNRSSGSNGVGPSGSDSDGGVPAAPEAAVADSVGDKPCANGAPQASVTESSPEASITALGETPPAEQPATPKESAREAAAAAVMPTIALEVAPKPLVKAAVSASAAVGKAKTPALSKGFLNKPRAVAAKRKPIAAPALPIPSAEPTLGLGDRTANDDTGEVPRAWIAPAPEPAAVPAPKPMAVHSGTSGEKSVEAVALEAGARSAAAAFVSNPGPLAVLGAAAAAVPASASAAIPALAAAASTPTATVPTTMLLAADHTIMTPPVAATPVARSPAAGDPAATPAATAARVGTTSVGAAALSAGASAAAAPAAKFTITERGLLDLGDFMRDPPTVAASAPQASRRPAELVVRILLPAGVRATDLALDVKAREVQLSSAAAAAAGAGFAVTVPLPYPVDEGRGKACIKGKDGLGKGRSLEVVLPVLPLPQQTRTPPPPPSSQNIAAGGGAAAASSGADVPAAVGTEGSDGAAAAKDEGKAGGGETTTVASPAAVAAAAAGNACSGVRRQAPDHSRWVSDAPAGEKFVFETPAGPAAGAGAETGSTRAAATAEPVGAATGQEPPASAVDARNGIDFVPAPRFCGAKPGYVFGTGSSGTGYFVDSGRGATAAATSAAVGEKASAMPPAAATAPAAKTASPPVPLPSPAAVQLAAAGATENVVASAKAAENADAEEVVNETVRPRLEWRQNNGSVSVIVHVPAVAEDTIHATWRRTGVELQFMGGALTGALGTDGTAATAAGAKGAADAKGLRRHSLSLRLAGEVETPGKVGVSDANMVISFSKVSTAPWQSYEETAAATAVSSGPMAGLASAAAATSTSAAAAGAAGAAVAASGLPAGAVAKGKAATTVTAACSANEQQSAGAAVPAPVASVMGSGGSTAAAAVAATKAAVGGIQFRSALINDLD